MVPTSRPAQHFPPQTAVSPAHLNFYRAPEASLTESADFPDIVRTDPLIPFYLIQKILHFHPCLQGFVIKNSPPRFLIKFKDRNLISLQHRRNPLQHLAVHRKAAGYLFLSPATGSVRRTCFRLS